ncbi:cytochrome P450- family 87- subfamily A-polypeptide 2 [Striga hermonthica]|uniref:ditrans,polycis-polyprenyl diphosphate synthase [(2E,6E)-farnesyldiphosphate specific] n=1 Tax=Striga hermonthica TaxID=68872 RepID=A0A9N7R2S2_STRHE|nr:cytochrome P450- family 87- subfamily A-polypeptide 2 [Striga hermonthica]
MMYLWMNPKCAGKLPPGSSGFPFIGETLQLFIPSYSPDVHPFLKKKIQRYGLLFRTNVVGHNVVVSADQELNRYIFQQEEKLVVHWYLDLFAKVFEHGEFRPDGLTIHKYTRNLVLNHFGSESIRQKLLTEFEEIARKHIHSWSMQDSIEVERASIAMFAELCGKHLYTHGGESSEDFADLFINLSRAAMSFPLNIPGTTFHKCLKDKEEALDTSRRPFNLTFTSGLLLQFRIQIASIHLTFTDSHLRRQPCTKEGVCSLGGEMHKMYRWVSSKSNLGLRLLWHLMHLILSLCYFVQSLINAIESFLISSGIFKQYRNLDISKVQYLAVVIDSEEALETLKVIELLRWLADIGFKKICLYDKEGVLKKFKDALMMWLKSERMSKIESSKPGKSSYES